jgi:hypothetical protein
MRGCFITPHNNRYYRFLCQIIAYVLTLSLVFGPTAAYAQNILGLPVPGTMVGLSPVFNPAIITGLKVYPDNPLQFDFIIDTGDDHLQGEDLKAESQKLINYFMATLTVPEDEMWVNLSPYEKDRIIADGLSRTEMGRDMLAQDYLLKQLTASLMYPEKDLGKKFWDRVYAKAKAEYGTDEIPMNTFNKVWIVPDNAVVYVHDTSAFIMKNHLKVLLDEDYLALESNAGSTRHGLGNVTKDDLKEISGVSAKIVREVLLPEIEREVNEGKNFANLRQMYNSMLLATWYKRNLKESLLNKIYADQNKVDGIDLEDKQIKEKIYARYMDAFKKGVYNYIKEDVDRVTQEIIPRKYFSGGMDGYVNEDGTVKFTQATGSSPIEALYALDQDPHVVATVRGQVLGESAAGKSSRLDALRDDLRADREKHLKWLSAAIERADNNLTAALGSEKEGSFRENLRRLKGERERLDASLSTLDDGEKSSSPVGISKIQEKLIDEAIGLGGFPIVDIEGPDDHGIPYYFVRTAKGDFKLKTERKEIEQGVYSETVTNSEGDQWTALSDTGDIVRTGRVSDRLPRPEPFLLNDNYLGTWTYKEIGAQAEKIIDRVIETNSYDAETVTRSKRSWTLLKPRISTSARPAFPTLWNSSNATCCAT